MNTYDEKSKHDIKNQIAIIKLSIAMLEKRIESSQRDNSVKLKQYVKNIDEALLELKKLVQLVNETEKTKKQ